MDTTPTFNITINLGHPPERPKPERPRVPWKALLLAVVAMLGLLARLSR
jgi:hypothetical protein